MGDDARPQRAAAVKNDDVQETDEYGKDDLRQVFRQTHTASVDKIQDVPQAEGNAGYDHSPFDAVAGHDPEQETTED